MCQDHESSVNCPFQESALSKWPSSFLTCQNSLHLNTDAVLQRCDTVPEDSSIYLQRYSVYIKPRAVIMSPYSKYFITMLWKWVMEKTISVECTFLWICQEWPATERIGSCIPESSYSFVKKICFRWISARWLNLQICVLHLMQSRSKNQSEKEKGIKVI